MKVGFDGEIKLEFHGTKVTSNGGLLAYRDLDYALVLFDSVSAVFTDKRTGRNIQHDMPTLLRQSIYSRHAVYEDVNDAECLSVDPVMRAFRLQSGAALVIRSGIQSGQLFEKLGATEENQTLVASQPTRETNQDRCESCQAQ